MLGEDKFLFLLLHCGIDNYFKKSELIQITKLYF